MATRSWNRVELIGNVTRDPEMRYTPQGTAVCTFSIATNRTFVTDGEKREETDFHRIVAWSKLAELCVQLIKKGNRIFVSGRLQNRSWETPEGQPRQMTEIVIEDMILLTSRSGPAEAGEYNASAAPVEEVPTRQVEEMPKSGKSFDSAQDKSEDLKTGKSEESFGSAQDKSDKSEKSAKSEEKEKPVQEEVGDLDDLPF